MKNIQIDDKVYRVKNKTLEKIEKLEDIAHQEESDGLASYQTQLWAFLNDITKSAKPVMILDKGYKL